MVSSGTSWPRSAPSSASTSAAPKWPRPSCAAVCPRPARARAPRWRRPRSSTGSPRSPTTARRRRACAASRPASPTSSTARVGVEAIGVGVASMVDFAGGRVVESVNLPLSGPAAARPPQRRFGVPVVIDNDATAAAIGEHVYGAGVGVREMLMLTLGTGVGGGIISGGRPFRGASGAAAELGHIIIDVNGPKCPANCPNHGCLEAYVGRAGDGRGGAWPRPSSSPTRPSAAPWRRAGRRQPAAHQAGPRRRRRRDRRPGARRRVPGCRSRHAAPTSSTPRSIVIGGGAAAAGELLFAPGPPRPGRPRPAAGARPRARRAGGARPRRRVHRRRRAGVHRAVPGTTPA